MDRTTTNSKLIRAAKTKVYKAFTNRNALEFWLAPYGMTGKIHNFNLRLGGGYEMSLFYNDIQTEGKTTTNEDRFSATFTEIIPYNKIVQTISFQSPDSKFQDEMMMEVRLKEIDAHSTNVTVIFKNIPIGINPKDNEEGTQQSLEKLAKYVEKE